MRTRRAIAALFIILTGAAGVSVATGGHPARAEARSDGIVETLSAFDHEETVLRLKKDVESKGIRFFMTIEQSKLAAAAGIELRPSTLIVFGNPALGSLFIAANPLAGLDWPVRVLVRSDSQGRVWVAYTDFEWVADRHRIAAAREPFKKATGVISSIISAVAAPQPAR